LPPRSVSVQVDGLVDDVGGWSNDREVVLVVAGSIVVVGVVVVVVDDACASITWNSVWAMHLPSFSYGTLAMFLQVISVIPHITDNRYRPGPWLNVPDCASVESVPSSSKVTVLERPGWRRADVMPGGQGSSDLSSVGIPAGGGYRS
jgi:hypothetical protein